MLRVRDALETRGRAPIALICDGVLFLENQPLSGDSLQEMCDEVGVTVCAKELTWAPPRGGGQSLWERLRARGSASGPMPIACDSIPDHACLVSACSMSPSRKGVTADMPPGPFAYREAQELLGARFNPAGQEDLASGGAFALHHADHAVGLDVSPSPSGKRLDAVTVYDGNFADTWHAQLSDALGDLSSGGASVPRGLFRVRCGGGEGCEDPSLCLLAGSDAPTSDTIILRLQKELAEERERFWKNAQAQKGSGSCYECFLCVQRSFSRRSRPMHHVARAHAYASTDNKFRPPYQSRSGKEV